MNRGCIRRRRGATPEMRSKLMEKVFEERAMQQKLLLQAAADKALAEAEQERTEPDNAD